MALPGVVGLGEVGLDYGHTSPCQKAAQQDAVERILAGVLPSFGSRPIVIHLRDDTTTQETPSEVHPDIIRVLSKLVRENKLAQDHRIQLHYFRGDQTTVLKWGSSQTFTSPSAARLSSSLLP
jgi:Tat protein secretion system quality control protein TatD with DNase activity